MARKFDTISVRHEKRSRETLVGKSITFDDEDANGLIMAHNNTLVIHYESLVLTLNEL